MLALTVAALGAARADDTASNATFAVSAVCANATPNSRIAPRPEASANKPVRTAQQAGVGVLVAALAAACAALRIRAKRARSPSKTEPKPPLKTP